MGAVRAHLTNDYWKTILLIEMIARTAKCVIREKLREKKRKTKATGFFIFGGKN